MTQVCWISHQRMWMPYCGSEWMLGSVEGPWQGSTMYFSCHRCKDCSKTCVFLIWRISSR
jgi:hypothetical protein